jgi:diadenosine tetraphosphate (Ap4A) HIT family hydrolase
MENAATLMPDCVSCEIVAGKRTEPGGTIYENEHWHVGSVIGPVLWRGFLIVKLKRHCEHIADLTPAESASLGPVLQAASAAVKDVIEPAKVYVCSFGDGVKHIHFWILPRPPEIRPGMHWVILNLDLRVMLTRRFGVKRYIVSDDEIAEIAQQVREHMRHHLGGNR